MDKKLSDFCSEERDFPSNSHKFIGRPCQNSLIYFGSMGCSHAQDKQLSTQCVVIMSKDFNLTTPLTLCISDFNVKFLDKHCTMCFLKHTFYSEIYFVCTHTQIHHYTNAIYNKLGQHTFFKAHTHKPKTFNNKIIKLFGLLLFKMSHKMQFSTLCNISLGKDFNLTTPCIHDCNRIMFSDKQCKIICSVYRILKYTLHCKIPIVCTHTQIVIYNIVMYGLHTFFKALTCRPKTFNNLIILFGPLLFKMTYIMKLIKLLLCMYNLIVFSWIGVPVIFSYHYTIHSYSTHVCTGRHCGYTFVFHNG